MKDRNNIDQSTRSLGFSGTKDPGKDRAPDFALADAASWPMHDRWGRGPFGALICDHCEAQLAAIFGRGPDGELSERAYASVFECNNDRPDDVDRASDREAGAAP